MIFAGTHQERCEIAANKCQCCHSGCAVTQRQSPAQCSDQRHYDECQALRKHVVKAEGGVECKVENRHAKRGNRLGINLLPACPNAVSDADREKTGGDSQQYTACFTDPLIFDRVLEDESRGEDQSNRADSADPGETDLSFKRVRTLLLTCAGVRTI